MDSCRTTAARGRPSIFSAPGFQTRITPSRSVPMIDCSVTASMTLVIVCARGGEHAGGEVQLVGAGLHLRQKCCPLLVQPADLGRARGERTGRLVDGETAETDRQWAEQEAAGD